MCVCVSLSLSLSMNIYVYIDAYVHMYIDRYNMYTHPHMFNRFVPLTLSSAPSPSEPPSEPEALRRLLEKLGDQAAGRGPIIDDCKPV